MRYDLEHHYYLPELIDYLATRKEAPIYYPDTQSLEVRENVKTSFLPSMNTSASIMNDLMDFSNKRLEIMDKSGIDVAVMSSSPAIEDLPKEEAVKFAKMSNDRIFELCRKHPDRFMGSAILPTPYVDEAMEELDRCINELGFKYWHTHSNYCHEHLYDAKYEPLLAMAEKMNCAIYIHPHNSDDADMKDMGYLYSAAGLGFGQDVMKTSLRMIVTGVFDRYPKLKIILGHLGEYYPFVLDRMDNRLGSIPDPYIKNKHPVSYYFKNRNIFVTTSGNMSESAFKCTQDVIGIDSILFGSDYPYEIFGDMIKFIDNLDITNEEREKIYGGNAEKYIL